jgi:hypothetical protein
VDWGVFHCEPLSPKQDVRGGGRGRSATMLQHSHKDTHTHTHTHTLSLISRHTHTHLKYRELSSFAWVALCGESLFSGWCLCENREEKKQKAKNTNTKIPSQAGFSDGKKKTTHTPHLLLHTTPELESTDGCCA